MSTRTAIIYIVSALAVGAPAVALAAPEPLLGSIRPDSPDVRRLVPVHIEEAVSYRVAGRQVTGHAFYLLDVVSAREHAPLFQRRVRNAPAPPAIRLALILHANEVELPHIAVDDARYVHAWLIPATLDLEDLVLWSVTVMESRAKQWRDDFWAEGHRTSMTGPARRARYPVDTRSGARHPPTFTAAQVASHRTMAAPRRYTTLARLEASLRRDLERRDRARAAPTR